MKKPLYYLDQYEKERILKLHENATKKQYLSENKELLREFLFLPAAVWWILGGTAALGGGAYFYRKWSGSEGKEAYKLLHESCSKVDLTKAKGLNTDSEIKSIAKDLGDALREKTLYIFGGTNEAKVQASFERVKSIPDYCKVAKSYESEFSEDLYDGIKGDYWDTSASEFKKNIIDPLTKAVETTKKAEEEAQKKQNGGGDPDNDTEDDSDNDSSDSDSSDSSSSSGSDSGISYTTCMDEFKLGCKDLEYTSEVKQIQRCLGLNVTGKFDKGTERALKSSFGKTIINADEIPLLCGNF